MKRILLGLVGVAVLGGFGWAFYAHSHRSLPTVAKPSKTYVALGDSVAAGVGLKDDSDSSACYRTNQSYPHVVAQRQHYKLLSVACSGATVSNGILGQQAVNGLLETPQLDALFARPKPDVVSITIGANDVNWSDMIHQCYLHQCGSAEDTASSDAKINALSNNLHTMLTQIDDHYKLSKPRVVITDYYQVYPAVEPTACGSLVGLSSDELTWLRDQRTKLNATIKDSVNGYSFARYADTDFSGHELCARDSWVQGLTASFPYHPTAAGQAAIASSVIKAINQ